MDGDRTNGGPRRKTPWQQRLDVLKSISLEKIAKEVNKQRLTKLRAKLAGSLSERERKKMRRVLNLFEAGRLEELPPDMRANARRMKRTLLAMFAKMHLRRQWRMKVDDIAASMAVDVQTARRGVFDLEDAHIVAVDRQMRHWDGGWGASEYTVVAPTLIDLACSQGLQGSLFDLTAEPEPGSAECARGNESPEQASQGAEPAGGETDSRPPATTHRGKSTSHDGKSTSHRGKSTSHDGRSRPPMMGSSPEPRIGHETSSRPQSSQIGSRQR